ncbi:hypothetical protein [Nocardia brasiliensis]|uniref:hypothetical protein n=1 Tax=Nocardia brasiliensis TaxID=37326 RepID=UPI0024539914|nr:hypothetical protein [Nocardia brasiliensis]
MHSLAIYQLVAMCGEEAHQAPYAPLIVGQAHDVMQINVGCRAKHCPRKAAALQVLIDAGRVKPSPNKLR